MFVVLNVFDIIPGREAEYAKYLRRVKAILDRHRARVLVYGRTRMVYKGNAAQEYCGIIEYPSLRNLRDFSADPAFAKIRHLRDESTTNYILTAVEEFDTMAAAAEFLENGGDGDIIGKQTQNDT
ncbi:MAG: DUF1330 domain-containing protein [Phycisphaerae bacterium]|nr:DUF1330 domain-containing protein [Phycisphaerae bacterium]